MMTQPLPETMPVCRDPDDDHVIAAALAVNPGYIVTGDRDLLVLARHEHIRIISAREFLEALARD
jgi:predicted nucleic acid-binding protein